MGDIELQVFADRLKELRTSLNLTQAEFVTDLGITASALSAYEKNQKNPSISVAKRIAEKYNISINWLCGLSEKKSIEDSIDTYSDILNILVKLDSKVKIKIKDSQYSDILGFTKDGKCIIFESENLQKYLIDWAKYKNLLHEKSIDDEIYQACLEKIFRESNTIINEDGNYPFT